MYREVTLTFFPDHSQISTGSLPLSSASSVNDDTSINKKKTHLSVRHFKEKFSFKMIFYTYLNYDNLKVNINKINDRFTFSYDFVLIKQLHSPPCGRHSHVWMVTPLSQLALLSCSVNPNKAETRLDFPHPGGPSTKILMFYTSLKQQKKTRTKLFMSVQVSFMIALISNRTLLITLEI